MTSLVDKSCKACRAGAPLVTEEDTATYMTQLTGWQITVVAGVKHLQNSYQFKDFSQALAFANKVGILAETANHHPAILIEWGKVTVTWWTHVINGLHDNDFIMAAKTDALY